MLVLNTRGTGVFEDNSDDGRRGEVILVVVETPFVTTNVSKSSIEFRVDPGLLPELTSLIVCFPYGKLNFQKMRC